MSSDQHEQMIFLNLLLFFHQTSEQRNHSGSTWQNIIQQLQRCQVGKLCGDTCVKELKESDQSNSPWGVPLSWRAWVLFQKLLAFWQERCQKNTKCAGQFFIFILFLQWPRSDNFHLSQLSAGHLRASRISWKHNALNYIKTCHRLVCVKFFFFFLVKNSCQLRLRDKKKKQNKQLKEALESWGILKVVIILWVC